MISQYENKKNNETNKILQLRKNITHKLDLYNKEELIIQAQDDTNNIDYTYVYEVLFKTKDSSKILSLYLQDSVIFKNAIRYLIRFKIRKMLLNQNISYPDIQKDEDELNYSYLEMQYNYDDKHEHFNFQYQYIKHVILEYIVYLYDYFFIIDLIQQDFKIYKELRDNVIVKIEKQFKEVYVMFNKANVGSLQLSYFNNSRYGYLTLKDYTKDYDMELCTQYYKMIYDETSENEESPKPCNTNRFFKLLEDKLKNEEGYDKLYKEVVIAPDKLLSKSIQKIKLSTQTTGREFFFYSLVKDIKRFTLNFNYLDEIKLYTEYLAKPTLFGMNLENEVEFKTHIPNIKGGVDIIHYKVHVKSVKNHFALDKRVNDYKNLKIIFEVKVVETELVFQVELRCYLKSLYEWKNIDQEFNDLINAKDKFDEKIQEFQEFLWYESNNRTLFNLFIYLILILAIFFTFMITIFLENYCEYVGTNDIDSLKNLGFKYRKLGSYSKSLEYFDKIEEINKFYFFNQTNEDYYLYINILLVNEKYDKAIYHLKFLINKDYKNKSYHLSLAMIFLKQKLDYSKSIDSFKKVIKIDPYNYEAHYNIGLAYYRSNDYEKAIESFTKAIEIDPYIEEEYLNLGLAYYGNKDYDKAINSFEKAISIDPTDAIAYINIGEAYYKKKNYTKAIDSFKKATEIDPSNVESYDIIGNSYYEKKDYDNAIYYFEKSLEIDPYDADAQNKIGQSYYMKKDYDKAIHSFEKIIEMDPEDADIQKKIAYSYLKEEKYSKAIISFKKALEIEPLNEKTLYNIGITFYEMEDYTNAILYLNKAIEVNPSNLKAFIYVGKAYQKINNHDKSVEYFKNALLIDPSNVEAYNRIGYSYLKREEYNKTIEYYYKAIKIDPLNIRSHINIGLAYIELKDYIKATDSFNQAIKIDPLNSEAKINIGYTYYKLKNYNKAIEYLNTAIELSPNDEIAYINIGEAYLKIKNYKYAIESFMKATQIDPSNIEAHYNMGIAYVETKEYLKAIDSFEKAIQIDPTNLESYLNIGQVYFKKSNYLKSIESFENAIKIDKKNVESHNKIGVSYLEMHEWDKAIEFLKKAIKLDPRNAYAYNKVGLAYMNKSDWDHALAFYKRALKIDPTLNEAQSNMDYARTQIKKYNKSIKVIDKLKNTSRLDNLDQIPSYKSIDYDTAIKYLKKVIEIDPNFKNAYYMISQAYKFKKDMEEEIRWYNYYKDVENLNLFSKIQKEI